MTPRARQIIKAVSDDTGVSISMLVGPCRKKRVSDARFRAMFELRQLKKPDGRPQYSYPRIGDFFGRDHTTAVHAVHTYASRLGVSP